MKKKKPRLRRRIAQLEREKEELRRGYMGLLKRRRARP